MANHDPAFLFYPKDWLEGTADMSPAEKGIYIDLLAHQHQRGGIPDDTKRIANMVGLSEEEFLKSWEYIKTKFHKQEDGKLLNKKLSKITGERGEYAQMRTIIGTFGGQLRALNTSEKNKERIRKWFDYKEFLTVTDTEIKESINSWLAVCLAKCNAKTTQFIEDGIGNEDEDLKKEKVFKKPTLDEFKDYFTENGFPISLAETVFKGYDVANWHKSNGNQILNWKQTCQQVWFKPENKDKSAISQQPLSVKVTKNT